MICSSACSDDVCRQMVPRWLVQFRVRDPQVRSDGVHVERRHADHGSSSVAKTMEFAQKSAHDHSFHYPGVSAVSKTSISLAYEETCRPRIGAGCILLAEMRYTTSHPR